MQWLNQAPSRKVGSADSPKMAGIRSKLFAVILLFSLICVAVRADSMPIPFPKPYELEPVDVYAGLADDVQKAVRDNGKPTDLVKVRQTIFQFVFELPSKT